MVGLNYHINLYCNSEWFRKFWNTLKFEYNLQESDSDFEFDGVRIKKTKGRKMTKTKSTKPNPTPPKVKDVSIVKKLKTYFIFKDEIKFEFMNF